MNPDPHACSQEELEASLEQCEKLRNEREKVDKSAKPSPRKRPVDDMDMLLDEVMALRVSNGSLGSKNARIEAELASAKSSLRVSEAKRGEAERASAVETSHPSAHFQKPWHHQVVKNRIRVRGWWRGLNTEI